MSIEFPRRIPSWRRISKAGVTAALTPVFVLGAYLGFIQLQGNIHPVHEGLVYRSAQLGRDHFESLIRRDHIRSILNLRGDDTNEAWYRDEIAVSKAMKVKHFDYGIGATSVVTPKQIAEILAIVRDAPKPLLIHCASGADRTGLISALYLSEIEGKPVKEAAQQLSIVYGHFPYFWSRTSAMDRSFWDYVSKKSSEKPRLREESDNSYASGN